jgi:hypothetical protein
MWCAGAPRARAAHEPGKKHHHVNDDVAGRVFDSRLPTASPRVDNAGVSAVFAGAARLALWAALSWVALGAGLALWPAFALRSDFAAHALRPLGATLTLWALFSAFTLRAWCAVFAVLARFTFDGSRLFKLMLYQHEVG